MIPLLNDDSADVRIYSACTLMHLALGCQGKQQLVQVSGLGLKSFSFQSTNAWSCQARAIPVLVSCLKDSSASVRMFCLQCMAALAEFPKARQDLNVASTLVAIDDAGRDFPHLACYAKRARNEIEWKA